MSGSKKFFLGLLTIVMILSLTLGLTFGVRKNTNEKNDLINTNQQYANAIEDLKAQIDTSIENVTRLEYQIELNGLTIDDLTKTIVVYEKEIVELEKVIVQKEVEIVEKNNTIVEKQVEVQELTNTITEKELEIVEIEKVVVEKEEQIVYLQGEAEVDTAEIERLQGEIDDLESQIASKNTEISNLQNQLADKNATIADLESQIETLTNEKETAENEVAEKETTIAEQEEVIVEKTAENEELTIEINVLNETIIELNVQITLLEGALEETNTSFYVDLLSDKDLCVEVLDNNDLMVASPNFNGIYYIDRTTLDYKLIHKEKSGWNSFVKLNNGNYAITCVFDSTNDDYFRSLGILYYELGSDSCNVVADYSSSSLTAVGDGDFLFAGCHYETKDLKLFDGQTKSISTVISEDSYVYYNEHVVLSNGNVFIYGDRSGSYYYYDSELKTVTLLMENMSNYISVADGSNYLVIANSYDLSKNTYIVLLDTFEVKEVEVPIYRIGMVYDFDDYSLLITSYGDDGIYMLDKTTYNITKVYDKGHSWENIYVLSNGNLVLGCNANNGHYGILIFDISSKTFTCVYNQFSSWDYFYELDSSHIFTSSNRISNICREGVYLIDITSNSAVAYWYEGYHWDTYVADENGITISSSVNAEQGFLYYSYETGEITKV